MSDTLFQVDPVAELDRRITELLLGKGGPWSITDEQRRILRSLRYAKGSDNPLPISRIVANMQVSERAAKAAVKSLVEDFHLPIGASRQEPYGYFLIVTPEDLSKALAPYENEIRSLARRVRTLAGSQRALELFGQVRAELESA